MSEIWCTGTIKTFSRYEFQLPLINKVPSITHLCSCIRALRFMFETRSPFTRMKSDLIRDCPSISRRASPTDRQPSLVMVVILHGLLALLHLDFLCGKIHFKLLLLREQSLLMAHGRGGVEKIFIFIIILSLLYYFYYNIYFP